jgi:hypothetical protein
MRHTKPMTKNKSIQSQGGTARAKKMTAKERSDMARRMVRAREAKRKRERAELERYRKANGTI